MKLDQIRKLIEAATPGPLEVHYSEQPHDEITVEVAKMIAKGGNQWFWVSAPMIQIEGDTQPITVAETGNGPTSRANAQFIAAARTLMPKLLAVAEAAKKIGCRGSEEFNPEWVALYEAIAALERE